MEFKKDLKGRQKDKEKIITIFLLYHFLDDGTMKSFISLTKQSGFERVFNEILNRLKKEAVKITNLLFTAMMTFGIESFFYKELVQTMKPDAAKIARYILIEIYNSGNLIYGYNKNDKFDFSKIVELIGTTTLDDFGFNPDYPEITEKFIKRFNEIRKLLPL